MRHLALLLAASLAMLLPAAAEHHAEQKSVLRHIVCFKFKKDATPAQIASIEKAFAALPSRIDSITAFEWGTNVSVEDKAKGFTHCFVVTFADKAGLEAYLPHEAHQAFVKELLPILDDAFVFDFVTP